MTAQKAASSLISNEFFLKGKGSLARIFGLSSSEVHGIK
jgi:hypothetical protein